jgi:indole-3-glycerol phosphate synthase
MTADFLTRMANSSRQRLEESRARCDEKSLRIRAEGRPPAAVLNLSTQGFDLIAEVKRRSPSMGVLADDALSPVEQARRYADAGAATISVLTEPAQFSGEMAHLEQVAEAIPGIPSMRKDFLVSPYQVLEARAAGAGGILLIAALLSASELREMLITTLELGMFALVEAFDSKDLEVCLPVMDAVRDQYGDAGMRGDCRMLIGVNCRDLRTLEVDFPRFETLADQLPATLPWVAESGVQTAEQARHVADLGYRLALVGTALMRSDDPSAAVTALISAGRGSSRH